MSTTAMQVWVVPYNLESRVDSCAIKVCGTGAETNSKLRLLGITQVSVPAIVAEFMTLMLYNFSSRLCSVLFVR